MRKPVCPAQLFLPSGSPVVLPPTQLDSTFKIAPGESPQGEEVEDTPKQQHRPSQAAVEAAPSEAPSKALAKRRRQCGYSLTFWGLLVVYFMIALTICSASSAAAPRPCKRLVVLGSLALASSLILHLPQSPLSFAHLYRAFLDTAPALRLPLHL